MDSKAVSQTARRDLAAKSDLISIALNNLPEALPGKPFATAIQEQSNFFFIA
jgi:hypothetical protein